MVRRVVGMTLLSFTDGATGFAVCSRRPTSLLTSSAVASPMVSVTMTISLIGFVFVLPASSINVFNLFESGSRFFDDTYLASIVRVVEVDITQ